VKFDKTLLLRANAVNIIKQTPHETSSQGEGIQMFGWFKKKSKVYTLDNLASEFISLLQKKYPNDSFIYDEKMNEVGPVEGDGPKIFLGNIFNNVKDMPHEDRYAYIKEFFETITRQSDHLTLETLKSFLLTRVRTPYELNLRELILSPKLQDEGFFSVNVGELFFDLTIDYGNSLSTPPKTDLVNAGGSDETVLDIALQNLQSISDDSPWEKIAPNIWASKYNDDYDAARLVCLYPRYVLPEGVENPIAYMRSHNICLITDKDDPETLALMVQKGDELASNARKLSLAFWKNKDAGWHPLTVDTIHPSYDIIQNQSIMEISSFYGEQKEQLENIFLTESKDIFVGSVMMAKEKSNDAIFSYSVLTLGVDTLLPKSERVAFVDVDGPDKEQFLGMVSWDTFVKIIGIEKLVPYEALNPVRYDFVNRLGQDEFAKIRQHFG